MSNEKDLLETQGFHKRVNMLSIFSNLLLSFASGFSMAR
jgi:hypothetical protein